MNNLLVWDRTFDLYFDVAQHKGFNFFNNCEIVKQFNKPHNIESDPRKKVVIVHWFPSEKIAQPEDLSWADLIICFTQEIITVDHSNFTQDVQQTFNCSNILLLVGGVSNDICATYSPNQLCYPALCFLHYVTDVNQSFVYNNTLDKPFLFDALLGSKKSFRKWIFSNLKQLDLLDKSLVSLSSGPYDNYYDEFDYILPCQEYPNYYSLELNQLDDPTFRQAKIQAIIDDKLFYSGQPAETRYFSLCNTRKPNLSYLMPRDVYLNSWYSIISETNISDINFITEKTFKCFLGGRIFICFGAHKHLDFVQQQGFKTFHGIIDESYDLIPDPVQRFQAAWQQVQILANSDPAELYKQAQPIIEHNYNLIKNYTKDLDKIKNWLDYHLSNL